MIAIDTSAIVAVLWRERDWERIRTCLEEADGGTISTGSVLELQLVLAGSRAQANWDQIEALFAVYRIVVRPFDDTQLRIARHAAVRFGKGRHRAALNFGDCFSYALARAEGLKLLCVGGDFLHTDLELA